MEECKTGSEGNAIWRCGLIVYGSRKCHENESSGIMTAAELLYYVFINDYQLHRNRLCYV
jgi:hypothetical protein